MELHEELKTIAESFRDWGRDCYCPPGAENTCGKRFCWRLGDLPYGYDHKYTYTHLGFNLKITDMFSDDLVDWLLAVAKASSTDCPIFNVGSDEAVCVRDLAVMHQTKPRRITPPLSP